MGSQSPGHLHIEAAVFEHGTTTRIIAWSENSRENPMNHESY